MNALLEELLACERQVWRALVTGDAEADGAASSEDFLGVCPDGFAGRAAHAGQSDAGPEVAHHVLSEARVLPVGPEHALPAYHAAYV